MARNGAQIVTTWPDSVAEIQTIRAASPTDKHTMPAKLTEDFERAIYPHLNSAYNLARWLLRNDQDAEDVVHDSFLRAHRYFSSFDGTDGRVWLLSIVRNACFTLLREKKAEPLLQDDTSDWSDLGEASPERALLMNEDLGALRKCIEALPAEYRAVIVMRELEDLSYKEIAAAAGVALGTVMSRLNRARIRLEACLTGRINTKESRT